LDYHALSKTGLDVWAVSFGTAPLGDMFGIADEATAISSGHNALTGAIHDAFHEGAVADGVVTLVTVDSDTRCAISLPEEFAGLFPARD
jgi:hypothetical protein